MNRRFVLGSHLYSQIVYPLLAASLVVGIIATMVAMYFLGDLTDKWVAQAARSSTENVALRYREHAEQLIRETRLVARGSRLGEAIAASDREEMQRAIIAPTEALGVDSLLVLDSAGQVVASAGRETVLPGMSPFGGVAQYEQRTRAAMTTLAGKYMITAFSPVAAEREGYIVAVSQAVDDAFLKTLGVGDETAYCLYGPDHKPIAVAVGGGFDKLTSASLAAAMRSPVPEIRAALADTGPYEQGSGSVRIRAVTYQIWAQRSYLPGGIDEDAYGYIIGVASQGVSEQAGRTTRNLIAMWSMVAVVALVGLGGWIARRVSDPLVELSAGARRIADGDFSTKVTVSGSNEIAELAGTFNDMTDSLRERSESLTKKVLELATLYEMSRALGSTLDMDDLLGSVLDSALRIFDLDLGYVALRDRESGALRIRAVRGSGPSLGDGAVRSSMSDWVVREGRPLIFNPDMDSRAGQVDTVTGAKAALCVPLVSTEGTIGSITIGSSRADYRFTSDDVRLLSTIANHVTIAVGNIELFSSLQEAYLATVRSLAAAVDAKDTYTRGHSDRVATYATLIAERMGLSHEQRIALEMAAYLHDIGKIGVPETILLKPGRLDDGEMSQMRHHPLIGANILKPVAFPWAITPVVRHHHEAWDGSGYPAGLKGEEIPLLARILTVADSYEAMTADRPYRAGRSVAEAIEELQRCSGTQFDPRIVSVFEEVIAELDESDPAVLTASDDVSPDEVRAIFAALVDGVFASFRRLGGPRLAANVEFEADSYFETSGAPFRVERGHLTFASDEIVSPEAELAQMREALRKIDGIIGHVSGSTLVEHFYIDAFGGLSGRMRKLARELGFYEGA